MKRVSLLFVALFWTFSLAAANSQADPQTFVENLKRRFGDTSQWHIAEIGDGHETALCQLISKEMGCAAYSLINADQVAPGCDLVVSNMGFSNHTKEEQLQILQNLLVHIPNGLLFCNFDQPPSAALSAIDLVEALVQHNKIGKLETLRPVTNQKNYALYWREQESPHVKILTKEKVVLTPSHHPQKGNAITYSFSGGRFGDNLVAYFHAKWIALKYGLPFIYHPFPFSNELDMDYLDPPKSVFYAFRFAQTLAREDLCLPFCKEPRSTLLSVAYFPEVLEEFEKGFHSGTEYFEVDWNDPSFQKELKMALKPKKAIATLELSEDKINVGMHIRRGGSFESFESCSHGFPLKFPPLSYFIEQLKTVAELFKDQSVYVHVFTDDLNPGHLVDQLKTGIGNCPHVEFSYRTSYNNHDANVLNDFFSFGKFDCFIGSASNFSIMGTKLGNYWFLFEPTHSIQKQGGNYVDRVDITFNGTHHFTQKAKILK